MLVIAMLSARWRKDEGIQRYHPRYENKVSVNSCFNRARRIGSVVVRVSQLSRFRVRHIWRIGSVLVHVSQLWWWIFQPFNLPKFFSNPIGELLHIQCPTYIRSKNIRNLNTFRAPDRCAIEKPKEFQYFLIIRSKNIRNLNTLCVVLSIEF